MRTTVTLDPDVAALIHAVMRQRGLSFKEALNSGLRAGLAQPKTGRRPFKQKTFAMGSEWNFPWDKALAASDAIEDEELTRKLSTRK